MVSDANPSRARGSAAKIGSAGIAVSIVDPGRIGAANDDDAAICSGKQSGEKEEVYAGGESGAYKGKASSSSLAVPFSWYIWQYAGTWLEPAGTSCNAPSGNGDRSRERGWGAVPHLSGVVSTTMVS